MSAKLPHHPSLAPPPTSPDPARFFRETLPKILRGRREAAAVFGHRLQFLVVGLNGGSWMVDLAAGEVFAGAGTDVDCTVWASEEAFTGLLNGRLDVRPAVANRQLEIEGASDALAGFVTLLTP